MNWYILKTKPNAHTTACEHLKRQGFDVFLPLIIKTTKKSGKFLDAKVPLFPGYMFVGTSIDPIPWKSINGTRGVSTVVSLDGGFRPVDTHIVENLQYRCDQNGVVQGLNDIASGDRIKIKRGPFAEFICKVDQIKDNQRAWILINLLQQQTKAEVSLNDISKIG